MTRFSDEVLMAYADGALGEPQRAAVEAALVGDAEARATVEGFRRTRELIGAAFGAPMSSKPPDVLLQTILGAPILGAPAATGSPMLQAIEGGRSDDSASASRPHASALPRRDRWAPTALAASLALAGGIGLGVLLAPLVIGRGEPTVMLGAVPIDSGLAEVLERHPSGKPSADRRWTVVATFRDRDGRACRELELLSPDATPRPLAAGVACRRREGGWTVEGAARIAEARGSTGAIEPAGVPERDALEGLLNLLGASRALPGEEERALIDKGWR